MYNRKTILMNYKIIQDDEELQNFINWLPECEPHEQYYISLLARKKYVPNSALTADKSQIKRITATKDRIIQKLRQMECEVGAYQFKGEAIPQQALAVYITPNPRDLRKAGLQLLKDIATKVMYNEIYNPKSLSLNVIQTSCSNKKYFDIDIDVKRGAISSSVHFLTHLEGKINRDCITLVHTHGGMHMLIELAKIEPIYKNTWYKSILGMKCEHYDVTMNGDNLIPLPGTTQGGKIP